jgi:hypothetical protein
VPIKGFNDVDLSAGYTLTLPQFNNKSLNFRVSVLNLFNNHSLIGLIGTTAANQALYATNPGRGVFFSISATL